MNWLITGGCGFIGKNLVAELLRRDPNYSIRILDNLSVGSREDLASVCTFTEATADAATWNNNAVQLVVGDIMDDALANVVTKGTDAVVHLAANTGVGPSVENPRMDCTTNVIGTFNYLDACRINGVKRFVFASSGAPIGECTPPIHEELAAHPVSPYGASKLAGEGYCSAYARSFGIETVALRFGNVYGLGSTHKSSVVAKFIRRAMNGETLEIYGDGTQTRDFIFTGDLLDAIYKAGTTPNIGGEVFQIATNKETTVNELLDIMVPIMEKHGIENIKVIKTDPRLGDVMRNFSDTTKAKNVLGWTSTTSLEDGVEKTVLSFVKKSATV